VHIQTRKRQQKDPKWEKWEAILLKRDVEMDVPPEVA
jgi:hypothetical protein